MEKIIKYIVSHLDKNLSISQDQREIAEYALYNVIITSGTLLGVLIIGAIIGVLRESVAVLTTGAAFRWSTGGAHSSKPYRCMAVSIPVPILVAFLSRRVGELHITGFNQAIMALVIALFVLSAVIIRAYAPAETQNKLIPLNRRARLRVWAYVTLIAWLTTMYLLYTKGNLSLAVASCLGLTWQIFSVTPAGFRIFSGIDSAFEPLEISFGRRNRREETNP